jgi:membrane-bound serine protease (ClpP class)
MPNIWLKVLTFIVLGFILLLIELFTPTFGVVGIVGVALIVAGCYLAATQQSLAWGLGISLASLIIIIAIIRLFPRTKLAKCLRLSATQDRDAGYQSGSMELKELSGKEGVSITPLRPSGTALIDGKRVDVVTEGIFLSKGETVKVTLVEGSRVVVRPAEKYKEV